MSGSAPLEATLDEAPSLDAPRIGAVSLGHALEFYDFSIYGFFAVSIGRTFFPAASPWTSLLLSVAAFGVGFVTRPLGAVAFGALADRRGRRAAMLAAIALMALGTFGVAAVPGYGAIGTAGPVLAVVARLVQGFAFGGEIGPSALYLYEAAKQDRRGRAVAWLFTLQGAAVAAAGLVGVGLASALSPAALDAWGWRAAVLLGLAVVPVGLVLRARLPDDRDGAHIVAEPAPPAPTGNVRTLACGVVIIASGSVAFYVGTYMVSFALTALKLPASTSFLATVASGLAAVAVAPLGGWWADRIGSRSAVAAGRIALALCAVPAFALLVGRHDAGTLAGVAGLVAGLNALAATPGFCLIIAALPRASRGTGLAVAYAVGVALFGGTTQLIVTALIDWMRDPIAPAYYLAVASLLGAGAALAIGPQDAV